MREQENAAIMRRILRQENSNVEEAQWKVLADCWQETVSAIQNGGDANAAYVIEKYLISGAIDDGEENIKAVVDGIVKRLRRTREIDRVKEALATGWIEKG